MGGESECSLSEPEHVSIQAAKDDFLADARRRRLSSETLRKYEFLFRQLEKFAEDKGLRHLKELDLATVRKFCESWTEGSLTVSKKLERLRSFFRFAIESKWVSDNPAKAIRAPKVTQRPTMRFTQDDMVKILEACDRYKDGYGRTGQWAAKRLRAFVLLLRYSGLRIGDAAMIAKDRIRGNRLFLYTQKTGVPVWCPLPDFVVEALEFFPAASEQHFFWSGTSTTISVARDYMRYLSKLFALTDIKDGHAHRLRDTFAVELLLAGVPIEQVSILLGHSSIRITEQHYAPWVKARQDQLEAEVRRTWARDPIIFAESKVRLRYTAQLRHAM